MLDFNNLPDDIKGLIFKHNRISAETEKNKNKFNNVMSELKEFDQLTWDYYIDVVMDGNPYPSEELIKLAPPWSVMLNECIQTYRKHYPLEYFD